MQKLYYSISEISSLLNEEQHVLRYWEKEFDALEPRKNRAGNRVYSEKDFRIVRIIAKLIRDEKLTIKSAKEKLSDIIEGKIQYPIEPFHETKKAVSPSSIFEQPIEHFTETVSKKKLVATLKDVLSYLKSN